MIFSSIPFLFFFFPIAMIVYYVIPFKYKNITLLIFSLIFYAWGEPIYIVLMLFSSLVDYFSGLMMEKYDNNPGKRKLFLVISIIINLSLLGFFKYADFLVGSFNDIFNTSIPLLKLGLPIGISFYTFQTMSYTIGLYQRKYKTEHNFISFFTYVSMFPQLIAGPIVRYETVEKELRERVINFDNFSQGLLRFFKGLFKKVLIANTVGYLWTVISVMESSSISIATAWLGIIAFTIQIYFDFSGYSDMAIGMGKMLGFNYLENFNYPYIAKSITDFWRRWHISLSSWFKDCLYIPLGGNRVSKLLNIRNILIVWFLTGLWHGAAYNFILWGLYYGIILVLEKYVLKDFLLKIPNWVKHLYTMFLVIIGWVIFAFDDMSALGSYFGYLFNFIKYPIFNGLFFYYLKNYLIVVILGVACSIPVWSQLTLKLNQFKQAKPKLFFALRLVIISCLFLVTIAYLVSDTYNPFLYFRF